MPTYEYECTKCGVFDFFQSMNDEPLARCPSCRRKVRRLIGTGAGIIFKGSGFYQTDYRSSSYSAAAKQEKSSAPSASSSSSSSSEPAASAPAKSEPAKPEKKAASAKEKVTS